MLTIFETEIEVCYNEIEKSICRCPCRSYAVCGGVGTDPGNVAGTALRRWHDVFCGGFQRDGAGCGTGVTVGALEGEIFFGISENV